MNPEETSRVLLAASNALSAAAHCVLVPDIAEGPSAGELLRRGLQLASFARECGCIRPVFDKEIGTKI